MNTKTLAVALAAAATIAGCGGGSGGEDPRIAFVSQRDGSREIYSMRANGTDARRLTVEGGSDPSIGPDGRIYFTKSSTSPDLTEFFSMNADGSDKRLEGTVNGVFGEVQIAPDGTEFIGTLTSSSNRDIYLINSTTFTLRPVATSDARESGGTFNSDGTLIALIRDGHIGFANRELTQRGFFAFSGVTAVCWSADSQKILFTEQIQSNPDVGTINEIALNGTSRARLFTMAGRHRNLTLMPDGVTLLFTSLPGAGAADIYTLRLGESNAALLTPNAGIDFLRTSV
jgi:Tol biopolymer transport system component